MTFSNKRVAKVINKHFVSAWKNLQPGYDWQAGLNQQFRSASACRTIGEGHSDKNIVTVFLTPDLKVLHTLPGYWYPGRFLEETSFVLKLKKAVLDKKRLELKEDGEPLFQKLHRAHQRAHAEGMKRPGRARQSSLGSLPASLKHGRPEHELQELLADVHEERAGKWGQQLEELERGFRANQIADFLGQGR